MSQVFQDDYDLAPREVPKTIGGKKYVLREASAGAAAAYRNAMLKGAAIQDGKVTMAAELGAIEVILVSGCLYDEAGKLVPRDVIASWPDRVVKPLAAQAKEISGLDKDAKAEKTDAKNGPSATTDTSA